VLIYLVVAGLLVGLVYWIADSIPLPQPINKVVKIVAVVVAALIIILLLLGLVEPIAIRT
jgi:hypothetical protein